MVRVKERTGLDEREWIIFGGIVNNGETFRSNVPANYVKIGPR